MRYQIRIEQEEKLLEDILNDQEVNVIQQHKYIPYISIETGLGLDELSQRYPDYHIQEDLTYDTQEQDKPRRDN